MGEKSSISVDVVLVSQPQRIIFDTCGGSLCSIKFQPSKKDKLEERMRNNPVGVRFDDLGKVLENHGFVLEHGEGSHNIFTHEALQTSLTIPKHGNEVKAVYVKKAMATIDDLERDDD